MFPRHHFAWRNNPARWTRIAIVLLAVLQFVAPSWHVCDLGFPGGCSCEEKSVAGSGAGKAEEELPPCCRHKAHGNAGPAQVNQHCPAHPFTGTCLARLLDSLPGSTQAAAPEVRRVLRLVEIPPFPVFAAQAGALPRRSGRGPPLA